MNKAQILDRIRIIEVQLGLASRYSKKGSGGPADWTLSQLRDLLQKRQSELAAFEAQQAAMRLKPESEEAIIPTPEPSSVARGVGGGRRIMRKGEPFG